MTSPKYRCIDCKKKHKHEPDRREKLEVSMACKKFVEDFRHEYRPEHNNKESPSIKYKQCIGNYYSGSAMTLINYYPKWRQNILPYKGTYFDQPMKFVEVMDLVHNLISEHEKSMELKNKKLQGSLSGKRSSKR